MAKEKQTTSTYVFPEGTKMVRVKVPRDPRSKRPHLFVQVNDYKYLIKFGEYVEVPDFIAEALEQREERMEIADAYITALEQQE